MQTLLKIVAVALYLGTFAQADDVLEVVANKVVEAKVNAKTVQKYRSLFSEQQRRTQLDLTTHEDVVQLPTTREEAIDLGFEWSSRVSHGGVDGLEHESTKTPSYDVLGLVLQTDTGEPVSVAAGVNITVFDSFITFDLVQGLGRVAEITQEAGQQAFEIPLTLVVGPHDKEQVLTQSFRVIDGSKLWEREQVMLGLGFMARVNAVVVEKQFLTALEPGLPILTGTKVEPRKDEWKKDEL